MERRLYFVMGDIVSNITVGLVSAVVCTLLFSSASNMFLAMFVGMFVGMLIGMVLGAAVFFRYFGAMEVMVPTCLTGMMAGMFSSMWVAMAPLSISAALVLGVVTGLGCLGVCYALQAKLAGVVEFN